MRRVFLRNSQRLREISLISIHFNRQFRLLRINEAIFRLRVISFINEEPRLIQQQRWNILRIVLPGNLQSRMEIPHVFVHLHHFRRFSRLNEVVLSLLVPFLILQKERVFQVNVLDFMLGVLIRHFERLVKLVSIAQILDNRVDQIHPQQHFHAVFLPEGLSPLFRQLAGLFIGAVQFAASNRVLPLPVRFVHLNRAVPCAGFNVVVLG